jgi:hypothetical protein
MLQNIALYYRGLKKNTEITDTYIVLWIIIIITSETAFYRILEIVTEAQKLCSSAQYYVNKVIFNILLW